MTIGQFLQGSTAELQKAGVTTARLDCLVLLEDELDVERAQLLAHPEQELQGPELQRLRKKITQRFSHAPLAYIRGRAPFFGRDFIVNKRVLVPRPESESVIEILKTLALPARPKLADIGTGSGCLGITAGLEISGCEVWLFDISEAALKVARQNAVLLGLAAHTRMADLAEPCLATHFDIVLANLPYVPDHYPINQAATHEPKLALFAGADGLSAYRTFWQQLSGATQPPAFILTESLPFQHHTIATLARQAGFSLEHTEGLIQLFAH